MIRLMFVATYSPHPRSVNPTRAQDSALSLMFDDFLVPNIDQTVIYYGPDHFGFDLYEFYERYGIITENLQILPDHTLLTPDELPLIDFRPSIRQQLIKLIALDKCISDIVLIQDCDIFAIKPYTWVDNNRVTLFARENIKVPHPEWHGYVKTFLDIDCSDNHCYMNEFLPIAKQDWQSLKAYIENKFQMPWLKALSYQFRKDVTNGCNLEFSEFEMLSRWLLHTNRADTIFQKVIKVPAPLTTAHGRSSEDWFNQQASMINPNCVSNSTQCRGTELLEVSAIIRRWISAATN